VSSAGGWILVPLVLTVVVSGIGLLAERAARVRLPGALIPAVGLAGLIVLAGVPAVWDATAEAAVPLVAVATVAGLVLARPWRDPRLRAAWPWPLLVAVAAFAIFAAPSLLTGQGSIAGYVKLDDSATWLALTDHVLHHGRDVSGLAPSSYAQTVSAWLGGGYPVGAFMPLGVTAALAGQDVVNAYQPVIATCAAIAALGLYQAARGLAVSRPAAAGVGVLAVQASLFLGYAQWGGIKEAVTVALLPALVLTATRSPVLLAVAVGAAGGVYGVNGMAWGLPALVLGAAVALRTRAWGVRQVAAAAAVLAAASIPMLATLDFAEQTTRGAITAGDELGNLAAPLSLLQGAGLWPAGDFRVSPDPHWLAVLLAVGGAAAAALAVALAVRRRAWDLPALLAVTLAGAAPALLVGSPWVDAKVLAIVSPVLLCAAGALVAAGLRTRARLPAAAGAALLAVGAALSTVAVVRDVNVAPRGRLAELRQLAQRVGDAGPLVVLDFEIYADRHFLREADPEGATDLRARPVSRRGGGLFPELGTAEVDEVATPDLWVYRTIVRRRSPVGSRPPAAFRRIWAGRYFEAWQKDPAAPPPAARLPLSLGIGPVAAPECAAVRTLAGQAGASTLVAAPRIAPILVDLEGWTPRHAEQRDVVVQLPGGGRWRVWVGGSVRGALDVAVDGRPLGSLRHELAHDGQWLRYGRADLDAGEHRVVLRFRRGLRGGVGPPGSQSPLGPLALTPADTDAPAPLVRVPSRDWRRLCDGTRYDWIESGQADDQR
jgi:hypothetical protein